VRRYGDPLLLGWALGVDSVAGCFDRVVYVDAVRTAAELSGTSALASWGCEAVRGLLTQMFTFVVQSSHYYIALPDENGLGWILVVSRSFEELHSHRQISSLLYHPGPWATGACRDYSVFIRESATTWKSTSSSKERTWDSALAVRTPVTTYPRKQWIISALLGCPEIVHEL
jgi:hypothetical protein